MFFRTNSTKVKKSAQASTKSPKVDALGPKPKVRKAVKKDVVEIVAKDLALPKELVNEVITDSLRAIAEFVKNDRTVLIAGFGKFKPRAMSSGQKFNPKTGEKVAATGRKSLCFKPTMGLKKAISG